MVLICLGRTCSCFLKPKKRALVSFASDFYIYFWGTGEINENTRKEAAMLFFFIKLYDRILCIIQSPCVESLTALSSIDLTHLTYCSVILYYVP